MMFKKVIFLSLIITTISLTILILPSQASRLKALIIDHRHTDISQIPADFIQQAQNSFRIFYGHTSHGSQIVTGMDNLDQGANGFYHYNDTGANGGLKLIEYSSDLGQNGDTSWADITRDYLNQSEADFNIVIWSWCGGVSDNTVSGINTYLNTMNRLESEYPNITFVYMTGHLDGTGESGNLQQMNNLIRNYASRNNKILFDFADIESYDPDGNYYLNQDADDGCNYSGGNWAQTWCESRPENPLCSACDCAHSEALNCNLKARAFWSLLAQLAGWNPTAANTNSNQNSTINSSINNNQNTNQEIIDQEDNKYQNTDQTHASKVADEILPQVEDNNEAGISIRITRKNIFLIILVTLLMLPVI